MTFKLYNTFTRKKEEFKPLKNKQVGMYTCGPTVYDFAHIGNFRAYVCADILRRYLEYKGFKVKQVMNLTDVDDKTIKRSQEQKIPLNEFTENYIKAFFEDLRELNIKKADFYPRATRHIKEMVETIKVLLKKGYAYKADDGSTYYDVSKFRNYGKLAHLKIKELKAGARVSQDQYEKEQANDFALWKAWDKADGDIFWKTELGKGRPGWHIECSVMSTKYLGQPFDIHTGGVDLIFPHHENEIAQAEAAAEKKFVKYWFHNEWLLVEGKKMSKSLGNFYTLRDLFAKGYNAKEIRYVLLSTHYRQQLNFTFKELDAARGAVERLVDFMRYLKSIKAEGKDDKAVNKLIKKAKKQFEDAMDDDLNISKALATIFDFVKNIYRMKISENAAGRIYNTMLGFDDVLGLRIVAEERKLPKEILGLIAERERARKDKDWTKADKIRAELRKKGIILEDTPHGVVYKMVPHS